MIKKLEGLAVVFEDRSNRQKRGVFLGFGIRVESGDSLAVDTLASTTCGLVLTRDGIVHQVWLGRMTFEKEDVAAICSLCDVI